MINTASCPAVQKGLRTGEEVPILVMVWVMQIA
jgi:hypothetical protein